MAIEQYITFDTKSTLFVVALLYAIFIVIFIIKDPRDVKEIKLSIKMILYGLLCLIAGVIIAYVFGNEFTLGTVISYLLFNVNGTQGGVGFSYLLIMIGLTMLITSIINLLRQSKR